MLPLQDKGKKERQKETHKKRRHKGKVEDEIPLPVHNVPREATKAVQTGDMGEGKEEKTNENEDTPYDDEDLCPVRDFHTLFFTPSQKLMMHPQYLWRYSPISLAISTLSGKPDRKSLPTKRIPTSFPMCSPTSRIAATSWYGLMVRVVPKAENALSFAHSATR